MQTLSIQDFDDLVQAQEQDLLSDPDYFATVTASFEDKAHKAPRIFEWRLLQMLDAANTNDEQALAHQTRQLISLLRRQTAQVAYELAVEEWERQAREFEAAREDHAASQAEFEDYMRRVPVN